MIISDTVDEHDNIICSFCDAYNIIPACTKILPNTKIYCIKCGKLILEVKNKDGKL